MDKRIIVYNHVIPRRLSMRDVIMNRKTNLLQLEEHFYQLVDVE